MLVEGEIGKFPQRDSRIAAAEAANDRAEGGLLPQGHEDEESLFPAQKIAGLEPVDRPEGGLGLFQKPVVDENVDRLAQERGRSDLGEVDAMVAAKHSSQGVACTRRAYPDGRIVSR